MSLAYRMDSRTPEEFAEAMEHGHREEHVISLAYMLHLYRVAGIKFEVIDRGVDNSGAVIQGALPNHHVDKTFSSPKVVFNLEIKTTPNYHTKFTDIKETSLKSCIEDNAYILYYAKAYPNQFRIIKPSVMPRILSVFKPREHKDGLAPGKPCSRIRKMKEDEYLGPFLDWHPDALSILYRHDELLKLTDHSLV